MAPFFELLRIDIALERLNRYSARLFGEVSEWASQDRRKASQLGGGRTGRTTWVRPMDGCSRKTDSTQLQKADELTRHGEVSEWSKEHAWKVCVRRRTEGSNPSLTAITSLGFPPKSLCKLKFIVSNAGDGRCYRRT